MKKVFISQPMNGYSDDEIMAVRMDALNDCTHILDEDVREIPSFIPNHQYNSHANPAVAALGYSIQMLSDADYVYFATGWEGARGCRMEHEIAVQYNMTILHD